MKTTNIKSYKMLFVLMVALTSIFSCSETGPNEKIAAGFYKYQYARSMDEIKPGTAMCVKELVRAGYLNWEDQRESDAVVSLDADRVVVINKWGCNQISTAKP